MRKRWLLDIGHGQDTWKIKKSKGIVLKDGTVWEEHDWNYALGMHIKKWAEALGIEVVLSQKSYVKDLGVTARVKNRIRPLHNIKPFDGLLSVHANASVNKRVRGRSVFHYVNSKASKKLAGIWDKYADRILDIPDWGKTGVWESLMNGWSKMYILWATPMPAILAEHFFFTNDKEREHCDTVEYLQMCAEVAIRTMCEWSGVKFKFLVIALNENKETFVENSAPIVPSIPTDTLANISRAIKSAEKSKEVTEVQIVKLLCDHLCRLCTRDNSKM